MRRRALVLSALLLFTAACSDDDGDSSVEETSTTTSAEPSVPAGTGCEASTSSSPANFDAAAGSYAAFITSFESPDVDLEFDVVQWLIGDDAVAAFEAETGETGGPPNDFFITNANSQLRTAPVVEDALVSLVRLADDSDADLDPASVDELPGYLTESPSEVMYWLTFHQGTIVAICEQFVP